ncbi:probable cytochrome P450 313a4 [Aedes albopictus]|uniref:Cytochrome n=1 Tax=Aedes albopictus TaxID=7160 RepID=A0ABM1ZXZ6_AEDAL
MWWNSWFTCLCASVYLVIMYVRWFRRKANAKYARMSGPRKLPLIGHAHKFFRATPGQIANTLKYFGSFPSPVCIYMGPLPHVAIFDPEQLQVILHSQNCLDKSIQYSFLRVSRTLISAPTYLWKGQRKALNPSFGAAILNNFVPIFNEKCAILTGLLEKHVGQPERNYTRDLCKFTLDQIYATALGCDFDMQRSPDGERSLDLIESYIKVMVARIYTVWKYPEFIYRMTSGYKREQEILKTYHETIISKLLKAIDFEEKLKQSEVDFSNEYTDTKKPHIFIDLLLKLIRDGDEVAKEDIFQQIDMILFAGNDTTAKTTSFILLMLAMHPEVQERCYREILEVCPGQDQSVSAEDVSRLPYLDMACRETMRLFPVGSVLARVTTADIKLNDEHTIPANSTVIMGIYQMHRDPKIWGPNADEFDPNNFLPEKVAKRHPYSYLPFSGGPRNCVGMRYAWLSLKILVVHMLRKYRLKTSLTMDQIRIKYGLILNIANGCMLTLERR